VPDHPSPSRRIALPRLESSADLRLDFWGQFAQTNTKVMRQVEQLADREGLTLAQFDVLSNLDLHPGLTQQDLAKRLQVTKGNICGLIDRLEKLKWVERRPDAEDRRANRLHLTPAGQAVVQRMRPLHAEAVLRFLADFSDDEVKLFRSFMERLEASGRVDGS